MAPSPLGPGQADAGLKQLVRDLIFDLHPRTHAEISRVCADLDLVIPPQQRSLPTGEIESVSKTHRLTCGFDHLAEVQYADLVRKFLNVQPLSREMQYRAEEFLWSLERAPTINDRVRREIAKALDSVGPIWGDVDGLTKLLTDLWVLDSIKNFWPSRSLRDEISQHFLSNDDWTVLELFKNVGALDCGNRRFARFIEGLLSGLVNPDTERQRALAEVVSPVFAEHGLKVSESGAEGGYPSFVILGARTHERSPHLILFASCDKKPDLRLSEVLDGTVEVLGNDDVVLRYDREVPRAGLNWQDLQRWWGEKKKLAPESEAAKNSLWARLWSSLPASSPPQQYLFEQYHRTFGLNGDFPALLPEVWLHWDPKAKAVRGEATAFPSLRMDFVMFLGNYRRVVLEVDGKQHYSLNDKPSPAVYAETTRGDRELRLRGYEVYRFAGYELVGDRREATVRDFFRKLFSE